MGVVLHKDSKWYQQWKDFKDNNVVFNSKDSNSSIGYKVLRILYCCLHSCNVTLYICILYYSNCTK